ncbi:hypothetical protein RJ639_015231 [Escallonia herrerae]|uniref:Uncharacterized protein n=1 Tax=Escallonia herrerae TaxID=1293975 RepID=A0AA89AMC5_9ASTE|nr:hypothetical protein RJ639_015231 [Escallonia herrerae]
MEQLQRIAMAHYQAGSDEVQQLAHDFFSVMDSDGDGRFRVQNSFKFADSYQKVTTVYFDAQLRSQPSTTVGQEKASVPLPPPSTSSGPGGVTNMNRNTLVQNFATHYPPTAAPNPGNVSINV